MTRWLDGRSIAEPGMFRQVLKAQMARTSKLQHRKQPCQDRVETYWNPAKIAVRPMTAILRKAVDVTQVEDLIRW